MVASITAGLPTTASILEQAPKTPATPTAEGLAPSGPSFGDRVNEFVQSVNAEQANAESMAAGYANGTNDDLHGTMIAVSKADISLRLATNIRNRVIEAYREVMRMGT